MNRLLIFGLGYSGRAVARAAINAGWEVSGTSRATVSDGAPGDAIPTIRFDDAVSSIAAATHVLITAPPVPIVPSSSSGMSATPTTDPVLGRYASAFRAAPDLRWIGYLSSTVVYGDRRGGWVTEATPPAPSQDRGRRRLDAEQAWEGFAGQCAVDIIRLAGIYGPGRSVFDDLREGRARRMIKPGHQFGRIHRDDIARAVLIAMSQDRPPSRRVLNLTDDEPSESATVVIEAAALLGIPPPPDIRFEDALATMSPMARSFWAENRKVACAATKEALGIKWLYPTYREGLRAILQHEGTGA